MGTRYQMHHLPDGRLHLHDGPIDLIIGIFAAPGEFARATAAAERRFATILDELCGDLPALRTQTRPGRFILRGPRVPHVSPLLRDVGDPTPYRHALHRLSIACRMEESVMPFAADHFITPMAAVAGAVAEEILAAMTDATTIDRAYVNNGGDIALHLSPGQSFSAGMIDRPDKPSLFGSITIRAEDPIRGIATSGWRGRSFSLGIADAVTVLAADAPLADAAATVIANAVDLPGHPAINRIPANSLAPDTDLGDIPVTQDVGPLTHDEVRQALAAGASQARQLLDRGLIRAAALRLNGETCLAGETRSAGILPAVPRACPELAEGASSPSATSGYDVCSPNRSPFHA